MKIIMTGSIPEIQSAINVSSAGNARVKIDFPATELAEVVKLHLFQGRAFKVIIEDLEDE